MPGAKGSKAGGKRKGAGRPAFKPTSEQRKTVEQLSAMGVPVEEMPKFIFNKDGSQICEPTLRKNFMQEIAGGRVKADLKVINSLFNNATKPTKANPYGNVIAQLFWAKVRLGWNDKQMVEHTGKDGAPIQTASVHMTLVEFERVAKQLVNEV